MEKEAKIFFYVQPNSKSSEIVGTYLDGIKAKVCAKPKEDEANRALIQLISKSLGVSKSDVRIILGRRSKKKLVVVKGFYKEEVYKKLLCSF